jgi:hypothetical protein
MCDTVKSVANEIKSHKLVVKGVVLSVDPLISADKVRYNKGLIITQEIGFLVTVKVAQQFKGGIVEDTIHIITGLGNSSGDCGFTFLKGKEYLIFASDTVVRRLDESFVKQKRVKRKQFIGTVKGYYTHICTRTQVVNPTEELEIRKVLGITAANMVLAKVGGQYPDEQNIKLCPPSPILPR